jgi:hypothetical protein
VSISHAARVMLDLSSDELDLEAWLFALSDADYQAWPRATAAQACRQTRTGAA